MKTILKDIIELEHVKGCLFVTKEGQVVHSHFIPPPAESLDNHNWKPFINVLGNINEADILFDDTRVYMRKSNAGYLLILIESYAILSLIKLQCDVLVPKLNAYKPKGLSRFFKK
jgi:hypothetical protein